MKGDVYTIDNPWPQPGKRTDLWGNVIPDEWFLNESDPATIMASIAVDEAQIEKEEAAIDAMLAGDDTLFNKLKY
ncbi:MAG: hypothetical protein IH584_09350 [Candidatus Aminicenantes bacterium]|nr:hypothetical protein [Candidatus Aminicenantes bacterium]